jgi:nitroreductase
MSVSDAIRARRSTRSFTAEPVPDDAVRAMVDAARLAPSGGNRQMWRFRALRRRATLEEMRGAVATRIAATAATISSARAREKYEAYTSTFVHFADAPCVIAVLGKPYDSIYARILGRYAPGGDNAQSGSGEVAAMSIGAAIENLLLAATALGYGSCLMTGPLVARTDIERLLGVSEPWSLVALVPIGRPDAAPGERTVLSVEEILEFD